MQSQQTTPGSVKGEERTLRKDPTRRENLDEKKRGLHLNKGSRKKHDSVDQKEESRQQRKVGGDLQGEISQRQSSYRKQKKSRQKEIVKDGVMRGGGPA